MEFLEPCLQSMAELKEILRVQGKIREVHSMHKRFSWVHHAAFLMTPRDDCIDF